jgi:hypothetical protein
MPNNETGNRPRTGALNRRALTRRIGIEQSFNKFGTCPLAQAFPEGSRAHPSYPTGHGADAGQLTVNGELNKLGHNVSFGHGIHAGIHFRSDTDTSLLLGEAVALNFLRNRARTDSEPFTVKIARFDGSIATISNGTA